MANTPRVTHSDGMGPDGVPDMVQKARDRRMGAEISEAVDFANTLLVLLNPRK